MRREIPSFVRKNGEEGKEGEGREKRKGGEGGGKRDGRREREKGKEESPPQAEIFGI